MKVSQLDQIKQAYESAVHIVQSIYQRINNMKDVRILLIKPNCFYFRYEFLETR